MAVRSFYVKAIDWLAIVLLALSLLGMATFLLPERAEAPNTLPHGRLKPGAVQ